MNAPIDEPFSGLVDVWVRPELHQHVDGPETYGRRLTNSVRWAGKRCS